MLNGKKIIVIDENKTDVEIIKLLLNDFKIESSENHVNIIKYIITSKPDCILLGCYMNKPDGFNLLNSLQKDEFAKKIPVIILTEHDSQDFALEITKNGASDYLLKGYFSKNNLIKSIFLAIERQKLVNTVYEQQKKLEILSVQDELTGIKNRRSLIEEIEKNIDLSKRYKFPLSLVICDIDKFKLINDNYGHVTGDLVIKEVAGIIQSRIRKVDIVGRHGGDEFVIVFPNTAVVNSARTVNSIRLNILKTCQTLHKFHEAKLLEINKSAGQNVPLNVSLSFGIADFVPEVNIADDLIARADEALYFAKQNGRNLVAYKPGKDKVCLFSEENRIN